MLIATRKFNLLGTVYSPDSPVECSAITEECLRRQGLVKDSDDLQESEVPAEGSAEVDTDTDSQQKSAGKSKGKKS